MGCFGCFLTWLPIAAFAFVVWLICDGTGANPVFVVAFLLFLMVAGGMGKSH